MKSNLFTVNLKLKILLHSIPRSKYFTSIYPVENSPNKSQSNKNCRSKEFRILQKILSCPIHPWALQIFFNINAIFYFNWNFLDKKLRISISIQKQLSTRWENSIQFSSHGFASKSMNGSTFLSIWMS